MAAAKRGARPERTEQKDIHHEGTKDTKEGGWHHPRHLPFLRAFVV